MRLSRLLKTLTLILFLPAIAAYADSITSFNVSGQYEVGHSDEFDNISGTVTIDTTSGLVDAINLIDPLSAGRPFLDTLVIYGSPSTPFVEIGEEWGALEPELVDLVIPTSTLVGYTGGNLCSLAHPCPDNFYSEGGTIHGNDFTYGTLSATPEPSSLTLLGVGALAMIGLARWRFI